MFTHTLSHVSTALLACVSFPTRWLHRHVSRIHMHGILICLCFKRSSHLRASSCSRSTSHRQRRCSVSLCHVKRTLFFFSCSLKCQRHSLCLSSSSWVISLINFAKFLFRSSIYSSSRRSLPWQFIFIDWNLLEFLWCVVRSLLLFAIEISAVFRFRFLFTFGNECNVDIAREPFLLFVLVPILFLSLREPFKCTELILQSEIIYFLSDFCSTLPILCPSFRELSSHITWVMIHEMNAPDYVFDCFVPLTIRNDFETVHNFWICSRSLILSIGNVRRPSNQAIHMFCY